MVQPCCVSELEQVIDTMIALTGLSKSHRAIIVGNDSMMLQGSLRDSDRLAGGEFCLKMRRKVQQMGFRIETGSKMPQGSGALCLSAKLGSDGTSGLTAPAHPELGWRCAHTI
ncbi:MAG: hypothetical protein JO283_00370 [Bradyrhizobium sp.]|nr:hypothetical protein [Bradyrhizobium sp.]